MNLEQQQHNFLFNLISGQDKAVDLEIEHALEEAQENKAQSKIIDEDIEALKFDGYTDEQIQKMDLNDLHNKANEVRWETRQDLIEDQQFRDGEIKKSNSCEFEELK